MHFNGKLFEKPNETMTINKFQRSRLIFDLSTKVGHILVISIYLNIVFLIDLKFHKKTR